MVRYTMQGPTAIKERARRNPVYGFMPFSAPSLARTTETARLKDNIATLNGVDPQAWLADVLGRIADHKITKLDELRPWHCAQT